MPGSKYKQDQILTIYEEEELSYIHSQIGILSRLFAEDIQQRVTMKTGGGKGITSTKISLKLILVKDGVISP